MASSSVSSVASGDPVVPGAAAPSASKANMSDPSLRELRKLVCEKIATDLRRGDGSIPRDDATRGEVTRRAQEFLANARPNFDEATRAEVLRSITDELFGLGPIQP